MVLINFVLFQLGWFGTVFAAAKGLPAVAGLCCIAVVALHIALARPRDVELRLIGSALLIGAVWESALVASGLLHYPTAANVMLPQLLAPHWIILMWAMFATTLNYSMAWLRPKPLLAALMGAIFGPLAFVGASKFGAVEIKGAPALAALSAGWALWLWLLTQRAQRWSSTPRTSPEAPV